MANQRTINVYNVTLTNANTGVQPGTAAQRPVVCRCNRTAVDVRMAFVTGKVAASTAPFFTLKAGGALAIHELQMADNTDDLPASASAGTVVEIVAGQLVGRG